MKKSKAWIFAVGIPLAMFVWSLVALSNNPGYYEIIDKYEDNSFQGNLTYYFIGVNTLDSNKVYIVGDNLFNEIKKNLKDNEAKRTAIIAYFFNPKDTTAVPQPMIERLKEYNPDSDIIKHNMTYLANGIVYVAVINQENNQTTIREIQKTMLFIPKDGKKAIDMMRVMGHS